MSQIGKLLTVTGIHKSFVVDLGELRIKLQERPEDSQWMLMPRLGGLFSGLQRRIRKATARFRLITRQVIAVQPPTQLDRIMSIFGIDAGGTIKVTGLNVTRDTPVKPLSDPRRVGEIPGFADASVVVFSDAHNWEKPRILYEACRTAILEGKMVIVLGDRHIGDTVAYMMAVSDEPQILTLPCTHVDQEGHICGEPASRRQWVNEDLPLPWINGLYRCASFNDRIIGFLRRYLFNALLRMGFHDQGLVDLLDQLLPDEEAQRFWEPPATVRGKGVLLEILVGDGSYQPRCRKHFHDPAGSAVAHGTVKVVIGAPESQKSAQVRLAQLRSARDHGLMTLVVSTRDPISRAGDEFTPHAIKVETAAELLGDLLMPWHQVVIIDEGTLMVDLGGLIRMVADIRSRDVKPPDAGVQGREVIVFGRGSNARYEPHTEAIGLMKAADVVQTSPAVCAVCGGEAMGSQYLLNGQPAPFFLTHCLRFIREAVPADGDFLEILGMAKDLEPRCRGCHDVPDTPESVETIEEEVPLSTEILREVFRRLQARDLLTWVLVGTVGYLALSNLRFTFITMASIALVRWSMILGITAAQAIMGEITEETAQEKIRRLIRDDLKRGSLSAWILVYLSLRTLLRILVGILIYYRLVTWW